MVEKILTSMLILLYNQFGGGKIVLVTQKPGIFIRILNYTNEIALRVNAAYIFAFVGSGRSLQLATKH